MASTNEDVVVLVTAPLNDGRLMVIRHLPDRGTVEIGWWDREESSAVAPGPPVLELAAEAVEVGAVARLCQWLLVDAAWDAAGEGAQVAAERSRSGVMLLRRPEGGELVLPSRAALGLLTENLSAALQKLEALGFSQVQQGDQASPGTAEDHA